MRKTLSLIFAFILICFQYLFSQDRGISSIEQPTFNCNNWLSLPSYQSYVQVGDLDIPGNQITVEAVFVRTAPYSNGYNWAGDIVSKHNDPNDVNYLLRPNNAEITTTNGYFSTPPVCEIELNKLYHAAMVYDGTTLKFYRNGFLMSSVPASGTPIQNDHNTRIGLYDATTWNTNLIGYVNEVRIWNTARTQAQIRANMSSSLPSPATQPGLLAYYTFNDLTNKQGNSAWNGTLGGSASINASTNACTLFIDSCYVPTPLTCNNWLRLPSQPSYVNIGDLDIPGTAITVEADFNTTLNNNGFGDLVAKHSGSSDANYLLRAYSGEITTSDGYFKALTLCPVLPNKIYHAAMVYDGTTLKFYRDGYLLSQVPATGSLFQNNWQTWIGYYQPQSLPENFIGYINEVRIWNVARTQAEIINYMSNSLPNPAAQPGLVAYYTFDDLLNKQGNPIWNGTLGGSAIINATSSSCTFVPDSCSIPVTSGISNDYTPVLSLDPCKNNITVENAGSFTAGDTVLIIQMKGANIDTTNTASFGTISSYNNAGNYEFNYIKTINGNDIELKNNLTRTYTIPGGLVQLIRVPYFQNVKVNNLTALPWDGKKGGVLVVNVADTLELFGNLDVSGTGFKGGIDPFSNPSSYLCYENQFYYPPDPDYASGKGEGIAIYSAAKSFGKGSPANGGGGGNSHNSGGGGGSNAGTGGFGGYNFEGSPCTNTPFDNRGFGGKQLTLNAGTNKIFFGGGGGAGHTNNPEAFEALGGNGGGIVIVMANRIKANGNKIIANGNDGISCGSTGPPCHEGMGGGGGAGTVLVKANIYLDNLVIDTKGGKGADMTAAGFMRVGPGGGGGGGALWVSGASLPATIIHNKSGGANGVATGYSNDPFGSTPGAAGQTITGLQIPIDNTPFRKNIDSVRIRDTLLTCNSFKFNGLAYVNSNPASTWQWDFGDGNTGSSQTMNHTYALPNTYTVKLWVTDINGCKDSISTNVSASILTMDAGPADTICTTASTTLQASASGATSYSWTPAATLNNPAILNPVASPVVTTTYYLTASNLTGCSQTDSVRIEVRAAAGFTINPPVSACPGQGAQLLASGGDIYSWTPAGSLNNAGIPDPIAGPGTTTLYTVTITDTLCGFSNSLSTVVTILPLPAVKANRSNDIDCIQLQSILHASGANYYEWVPGSNLNNAYIASPTAQPLITTKYTVKGTDLFGCVNYDTVTVKVTNINNSGYSMPTAFTPNNDGLNDCYGIKYWGTITELEFSIYNRWGQRIFYTTDPYGCWDGNYKGVAQDPNVFVYMIRAKTVCGGEIFRKGTFALIR